MEQEIFYINRRKITELGIEYHNGFGCLVNTTVNGIVVINHDSTALIEMLYNEKMGHAILIVNGEAFSSGVTAPIQSFPHLSVNEFKNNALDKTEPWLASAIKSVTSVASSQFEMNLLKLLNNVFDKDNLSHAISASATYLAHLL